MVDRRIDLDTHSETMSMTDREHESLPWSRCVCEEVMDLWIVRIYWEVYEFESGISQFPHVGEACTHHAIGDNTRLYTCLLSIRYPSREIRRECWFASCEYHSSILTYYEIIDNFYSLFIRDILSVWWIRTKMTCIVTVAIDLDVSDICHSYSVIGWRRSNQYDLIKLICNHSQLSLYLQDLQRIDFLR